MKVCDGAKEKRAKLLNRFRPFIGEFPAGIKTVACGRYAVSDHNDLAVPA